ncbi:MAG: tetratricopeptide repeat protein [Gemmataceae bacterium]|nr:tetratricopeptide repeat protein [Gemmataceae bacterium]MCI0743028.1 tetratricopeptide repeat protein [Gemmataceae bacterium]
MSQHAQALLFARQLYAAGRLDEAEQTYQEIVRADPNDAEAWCFLGLLSRGRGRFDEAAEHYRRALDAWPDFVEVLNNLGNILVLQGKLEEAESRFRHVLRLRPEHAESHNNLGVALRYLGKTADAVASYREALRIRPEYPDALNNLGDALYALGRTDEAVISYQHALRLRPNYAEAHNNLGVALARQGKNDEAIAHYQEALRHRPKYVEAYSNLGNALAAQLKRAEAVAAYQQALALKPEYAPSHYNLGIVLAESGKLDEAVASYRQALQFRPDYAEALSNLGNAYRAQGNLGEAMDCYHQLVHLKPGDPEAYMNRAMSWLLLGDYERGWKEYEWRWQCKEFTRPAFEQPVWDGAPLEGKTILLTAEQGLGDTLQYVRYAKLVRERGGRVLFHSPKALTRLLADCPGIDQLVPPGSDLPAFDVYAPLLSLPNILGTTLSTVPADVPYLGARQELVDYWRHELERFAGFRVAIAWQGNPQFRADRYRSVPLAEFAELAKIPGVRLVSVQKGHGVEQIGQAGFEVIDLSQRLDEAAGPFLDTAAVMKAVDLVITTDSVIAHLAGALGVPVWIALSASSHFCWLMDREDSPWYPTARLFRQQRFGDWKELFASMAGALREAIGKKKALPKDQKLSVRVEISPGELIDKLTILLIKKIRLKDAEQIRYVDEELATLMAVRNKEVPMSPELAQLTAELRAVNETLWDVEDKLRRCEREQRFGRLFVNLARSVYVNNDKRASLKRRINELLGSKFQEEKSYPS